MTRANAKADFVYVRVADADKIAALQIDRITEVETTAAAVRVVCDGQSVRVEADAARLVCLVRSYGLPVTVRGVQQAAGRGLAPLVVAEQVDVAAMKLLRDDRPKQNTGGPGG